MPSRTDVLQGREVSSLETRGPSLAQRARLVATMVAMVVAVDQVGKYIAWRGLSSARINVGGDALVGQRVSAWFGEPLKGAALDAGNFVLLVAAVALLIRARTSRAVAVSGAAMLGGWGSNLLDRLGLHFWTAPGSARGAVDFMHLGAHYYNLADLFIIVGTPMVIGSLVHQLRRRGGARLGTGRSQGRAPGRDPRVAVVVTAAVATVLLIAVGIGATHVGGVTAPFNLAAAVRP